MISLCDDIALCAAISKRCLDCVIFRLRKRRTHQADNLAKLWQEFLSVPKTDSKDFLRGRDCENKCGDWQPPLCLRFYLWDSHVALLLGMTFGAIAITATPFEQLDEERENAPRTATLTYSSVRELKHKGALKRFIKMSFMSPNG